MFICLLEELRSGANVERVNSNLASAHKNNGPVAICSAPICRKPTQLVPNALTDLPTNNIPALFSLHTRLARYFPCSHRVESSSPERSVEKNPHGQTKLLPQNIKGRVLQKSVCQFFPGSQSCLCQFSIIQL